MKESELSEEFRNRSNCWADTEDAIQAMDEPTAIQFAKDYAADVTKTLGIAQGKIGELNNDWTEIVAAKDADLKRITHERDVLCEIRDMSYREIAALKADKARLREGILDIKGNPSKYFEEDYPLPEHPDRMQLKTNYVAFNALLSPADGRYQSICTKCEAAIEACECEFDGDDDANNHTKRVPAECLCSHTIDGRLAKQCDNCRNKPFVPADGVMAPAKPDIEIQPEDVMVVGNCANCGVEFHIHKQDSPADGDGVEENDDEYEETEEDREWLASYNQQVAWKYQIYNPETTEYRAKSETRGESECWHCEASLVGKFDMCCKSYSNDCGCYGLPVEPPFCSKECHIDFIAKWKGSDGTEKLAGRGIEG